MKKGAWLKREVEEAAADVKKWPAWMRNDDTEKATKNDSSRAQAAKSGKK